MTSADLTLSAAQRDIRAGQRRTRRRETILGLLFVAPAALVTFMFGLFPVVSGFFISLQGGGTIIPEGFNGLANYFAAVGSLAYVLVIGIGVAFAIGGYYLFRGPYKAMRDGKGDFYPFLVPAILAASATLLLLALLFTGYVALILFPIILLIIAIAGYVYLRSRQQSVSSYIVNSWLMLIAVLCAVLLVLFVFSDLASSLAPYLTLLPQTVSTNKFVMPLMPQFLALIGAAAAAGATMMAGRIHRQIDTDVLPRRAFLFAVLRWIMLATAILLIVFDLGALELLRATVSGVRPEKLAALTSVKPEDFVQRILVWPEVFGILLGVALIGLGFLFWSNANRRDTTLGMLGMIGIAILFMIGGWLFISQLPDAAINGDVEFYQSLLRTATYSLLTVPTQLSLGLLLAYLLFYEVRTGKSFYRVVFFIPYIAPTVATAAVFSVIFSLSSDAPANQFMTFFGLPQQQWLRSTQGVFQLIAQWIGGRQTQLPSFLVGPPLPLLSAIFYSVWVFSGYDAVIFLAGLGAVPREMIEAAQVDGAGRWANFRHIIFPLISPTTFFLSVLAIIGTVKAIDHIYVLRDPSARGTMDTAAVYIFRLIREGSAPRAYQAATAFILFGIVLILTIAQSRISRDQVFYG